jgi:hypothetical protein
MLWPPFLRDITQTKAIESVKKISSFKWLMANRNFEERRQ